MPDSYRQYFDLAERFPLRLGGVLPGIRIAYETWGTLNERRDNAILLFTGLSASAHAKSHGKDDRPGWWEAIIGPGLGIDTDRFFVICFNHLGGCFGSTGPSSLNPATGKPYGPDFPPVLLQDLVRASHLVVLSLGINEVYCSMGASMGGMVAMEYAAANPATTRRMIMISASGRPGPTSIAFRFVQRQIILADPAYHDGWYYDQPDQPEKCVAVARQ